MFGVPQIPRCLISRVIHRFPPSALTMSEGIGSPAQPSVCSFQSLLQRIGYLSRLSLWRVIVSISLTLVAFCVKVHNLSCRSSLCSVCNMTLSPDGPTSFPLSLFLSLSFPDDPTKWLTCVTSPIDLDEPLICWPLHRSLHQP